MEQSKIILENINFGGLFWKLAIPVILLFGITIMALGFYIPGQIEARAVQGATASAKQTTATQFKVLRKYYVQNILKKVKAGSGMTPAINHQNNPNTFPLPATMIHDLGALLKNEGTTVNLYSAYPFPNRKSRIIMKSLALPVISTGFWKTTGRSSTRLPNPHSSYQTPVMIWAPSLTRQKMMPQSKKNKSV